MKNPIAISLSPNAFKSDVSLALKNLFSPFSYIKGENVRILEQWFRQYFGMSHAVSFSSGRGALYVILGALGIQKGDEVITQSFTCVAVPNSIVALGATPVYIDIDTSLTLEALEIESKITKKTKAIIVQHTFGIPSDMEQILRIAKKYKVFVIEDCAHTIGGEYKGKKLGTFGIASFFSFGRDKAFSSVFGGMAITRDQSLGKRIRNYQRPLPYPGRLWIASQLFHPIAFFGILPFYTSGILAKAVIVLFQRLSFLSLPVTSKEKEGEMESEFVKKLPNSLASLALFQLKRITVFNDQRKKISEVYEKKLTFLKSGVSIRRGSVLLRYPILIDRRDEAIMFLRKKNIYVGNWYSQIIDPKGVNFKKMQYHKGMCPNAEIIATRILNLPTYPKMTVSDAEIIVSLLKQYVENKRN